jgi:S1-C subfamily serine protease
VKRVVPQLIEFGVVTLPGLNIVVADPNVSKTLGVRSQGVLVQSIPSKSAAEKAGLLPTRRGLGGIVAGDVIVGADGAKIGRFGRRHGTSPGWRCDDPASPAGGRHGR